MFSGDKTWKWTGHKEAMSTLRSCDAECKERDPHLNWNGDTSQYPYCNCVCEAGWEFDASGKSCVPAGTSDINPCEAECKARAPAGQLSHMVWNGDTSQYPYCNCVCEAGWEFDVSGKSCVPAGTHPTQHPQMQRPKLRLQKVLFPSTQVKRLRSYCLLAKVQV